MAETEGMDMVKHSRMYDLTQELKLQLGYSGGEKEGIDIWYLGQAGFLLQRNGLKIAIDPYLIDSVDRSPEFSPGSWQRRYLAPFNPHLLEQVDLVLCTHEHMDHLDPETIDAIANTSPQCRFAAPPSCRQALLKSGVPGEQIIDMVASQPHIIPSTNGGKAVIHPIPAAHENYELDENGHDLYLGYVIEWNGICLYYAGDTLLTEQLIHALQPFQIDIGFVPINGRDILRNRYGILGNMFAQEAVELAAHLQFNVVVPIHYDLYLNNGGSPAVFVDYLYHQHPEQKVKLFTPGERYFYPKLSRTRPVAIVIGAGKTGRGFIARLLMNSEYRIIFVDHSIQLVNKLNQDQSFSVHYFNEDQSPTRINGVTAHLLNSAEAVQAMANAEIIFTAVGEQNLPSLATSIIQAQQIRSQLQLKAPMQILTCENGVAPGDVLQKALNFEIEKTADSVISAITIAESAIFCSTVELGGTRLDILSEAYHELPYDARQLKDFNKIPAMEPVEDFKKLLQRKIYTYNCISAVIAYLGAFKGYEKYADAANDPDICSILQLLAEPLNHAISIKLSVDPDEQRQFAKRAIMKFSDRNISDDITRNARDVIRKLGPNERLIAPAIMIEEVGGDNKVLALVIAAALCYEAPTEMALLNEIKEHGVVATLIQVSGLSVENELLGKVKHFYKHLQQINFKQSASFNYGSLL